MQNSTLPPFGFTDAWFALGIVDKGVLDRLCVAWHKSGDHTPERYRRAAFDLFVGRSYPLSPDLAVALYDLGATDSDPVIGDTMMRRILQLPGCPVELLQRAFASDRPHLVRIARRRLNLPEPSV